MIESVFVSLTAAALLGAGIALRRWLKRGAPLTGTGEVVVPKAWEVALPTRESLPEVVPQQARTYLPLYRLLRQRGASDFKATTAKLLLENATENALTITDIRVHKERVDEPFDAVWVRYPPAGAAGAIVLDFLLDEEHPRAWSAVYEDSLEQLARTGQRPYFDDHTITLAREESQSLLIIGRAEGIRCSWWLKVEVVQAGKRRTIDVRPEDGAFRTSGTPSTGFRQRLEWSWYEGAHARFTPPPELT